MRLCAEDVTGLKHTADAAGGHGLRTLSAVGERSQRIEAVP